MVGLGTLRLLSSTVQRCNTDAANAHGGAGYITGGYVHIHDSTIDGCTSTGGGGALAFVIERMLAMKGPSATALEILNSSLSQNIAPVGTAIELGPMAERSFAAQLLTIDHSCTAANGSVAVSVAPSSHPVVLVGLMLRTCGSDVNLIPAGARTIHVRRHHSNLSA